jgi:polyisoprenoid-binding protein YceI
MKNNFRHALVFIAISLMGFSGISKAQSIYKTGDSKDNSMKLSGTSTMHDWVMNAGTFTGDAQFNFKSGDAGQLDSIKSLTFSLPVLNLKSDSKKLDRNAYKALKTNEYKNISYKLTSATVSSVKENKYLMKTQGNLTIAGVTKEIAMDVYCVVNNDATITCNGSEKLKMTDYEVDPPSFLGVMNTGDNITLDFTLVYKK